MMQRNPYLNRSMIRSVAEFYGRRQELQRIMARVGASTPQSVSLVGERRMGKSSLMWYLSQPEICTDYLEEPERYIFLFLDFQGQQHLDQAGFCRIFGDHLTRVAGDRLRVPSLDDLSDLERLAQAVDGDGLYLVCLFDEFETVTRNAEFSTEFFGALRSLANVHNLAYVTASRRNLQSLCHTEEISESPFFNIFSEVHVGAMGDADIRELIEAPSAAAGLPLAPHADTVLDLGGQLPFFVQIACSAAFECLTGSANTALDEERLEAAFLEEASSHFRYLLETFDAVELEVIHGRATATGPPAGSERAIQRLQVAGYVSSEGGEASLFSRAFAHFVRDHAEVIDPVEARGGGSVGRAPERGRALEARLLRPPLVYIWPLVAVLLIGLGSRHLDFGGDGTAALSTPPANPVTGVEGASEETSEGRPQIRLQSEVAGKGRRDFGLQVGLHIRKAGVPAGGSDDVLTVSPSSPVSGRDGVLAPQDRYRIELSVVEDCYLYVYRVDASGAVSDLVGRTPSRPLEMVAGRTELVPPGADEWMTLDGTAQSLKIFVLTSAERDRNLGKRYQSYGRATGDRRRSYGEELAALASQRAAVQISVPVAADGD